MSTFHAWVGTSTEAAETTSIRTRRCIGVRGHWQPGNTTDEIDGNLVVFEILYRCPKLKRALPDRNRMETYLMIRFLTAASCGMERHRIGWPITNRGSKWSSSVGYNVTNVPACLPLILTQKMLGAPDHSCVLYIFSIFANLRDTWRLKGRKRVL